VYFIDILSEGKMLLISICSDKTELYGNFMGVLKVDFYKKLEKSEGYINCLEGK